MKKKRPCKRHETWMLAIIPWGQCQKCGQDVREYLHDVLARCYAELPSGETKAEVGFLLDKKTNRKAKP